MTYPWDDLQVLCEIQEDDGPIVREFKLILASGLPVRADALADGFEVPRKGGRPDCKRLEGVFETRDPFGVREAGVGREVMASHLDQPGTIRRLTFHTGSPREFVECHWASLSRWLTAVKKRFYSEGPITPLDSERVFV